jgi:serine/threonine protein kinase
MHLEQLDDGDWTVIDSAVSKLEEAWRTGSRPDWTHFVPDVELPLRRAVLIELIKVDQEYRQRNGKPQPLEKYVATWPELRADTAALRTLLEAECLTRALQGDRPSRAELRSRFIDVEPHVDLESVLAECEWEHEQIAARNTTIFNQSTNDTSPIPASILQPPEQPGEIGRLGHYRILSVLGSGGMGVVFQAEDQRLGRHVAIKTLKSDLALNPEYRKRFLREARAAAHLNHDHVVTIHQVDEVNGVPYLAMQLLQGETLERRLHREKTLTTAEIIRIGCEISDALSAAHEAGLTHRDVKPANIWLEAKTDRVKLLDFGLAHVASFPPEPAGSAEPAPVHNGHDGLTRPGEQMGTPGYMAPELFLGESADARSDLFAFGCVLYHCSTGELPFGRAVAPTGIMGRDLGVSRRLGTDRPAAFCELILKMLARQPGDRPQKCRDVLSELQKIRSALAARQQNRRMLIGALSVGIVLLLVVVGFVMRPPGTLSYLLSGPVAANLKESHPVRFVAARQYAVEDRPFDVATTDFNHDGFLDLVVSNLHSHSLSLWLGRDNGEFEPAPRIATANYPYGIALGDYNEDQHADIAVATENGLDLLLGQGTANFVAAQRLELKSAMRGIVTADLDGDGHLDLAASDSASKDVAVWFGAGNGTFHSSQTHAVQDYPVSIAAADLNRDRQLDLIVSNGKSDSISVLLAVGDRRFGMAQHIGVGSGPGMIVVADLNRDEHPDVAVENFGTNDVTILWGRGDGNFRRGPAINVGSGPGGLDSGDFNGDGWLDLVVANHLSNSVNLLLGRADGTLELATDERVGETPVGIAVGDFDGDGREDFAVANHHSTSVSVVLNPEPRAFLRVAMPLRMRTGLLQSIVVTAADAEGNPLRDFKGVVHFTSDDPNATLPADYEFQIADEGSRSFYVTFKSLGPHTLSASCISPQLQGGSLVVVQAPQ